MALKRKLTVAEFDKLSDAMKAEYKKEGDAYTLDVEGDDDVGALRRANERNKLEADEAKAAAKKAAEELAALKEGTARNSGDVAALDKSWQEKFKAQQDTHKAENSKLTAQLETHMVGNVARDIASKISTAPALLIPHILPRLKMDLSGEAPVTRILDASGKISALTVEDLQKEIASNKEFAPIIAANRASGSGGAGNGSGGAQSRFGGAGANANNNGNPPQDLSKMAPGDLAAQIAARKAANQTA
jgi:hypothetical protein